MFREAIVANPVTSYLLKSGEGSDGKHNEEVITNFVKRLEMQLETPDIDICKQNAEPKGGNDCIYLISKGPCRVSVQDKFDDRPETTECRIIEEGCHFGEISMVFRCRRSATVTSIEYL